ncbi:Ca(2+)-dependent cysteine protease [Tulasnella sp. 403]|nr:Ca(2+)-dependent cysteine protease [Tulasnella sp. 403]
MSCCSRKPANHPTTEPATGTRKALLIGIEYNGLKDQLGNPMHLKSTRRDAERWRDILMTHYGYEQEDIVLMTESADSAYQPTYENVVYQLKNLVRDVRPGDKRFLFVASHGIQINKPQEGSSSSTTNGTTKRPPQRANTELDSMDEAIITITPWPERPKGIYKPIKDNYIKEWVVDPLVPGSILTAVIDTCHSGTLLDLPYRAWLPEGGSELKFENARTDTATMTPCAGSVLIGSNWLTTSNCMKVCVSACADHEEAAQFDHWEIPQEQIGALSLAMASYFDELSPDQAEDREIKPIPIRTLLERLDKSEHLEKQTPWVRRFT